MRLNKKRRGREIKLPSVAVMVTGKCWRAKLKTHVDDGFKWWIQEVKKKGEGRERSDVWQNVIGLNPQMWSSLQSTRQKATSSHFMWHHITWLGGQFIQHVCSRTRCALKGCVDMVCANQDELHPTYESKQRLYKVKGANHIHTTNVVPQIPLITAASLQYSKSVN